MPPNNILPDSTQNTRIDYIDIFRGFGIILMVMGHIGYGKAFDLFIHAFHMPMFFWISGYLFSYKAKEEISFTELLKKKAKSLLLPYVIFGVSHYFLYIVKRFLVHDSFDISPLIHLFSVNTDGLAICRALWFLTSLFFTDILFFLIHKYVLNGILKTIVVIVVALIGNYTRMIFPFTLPFALGPSFVGVGLYYIGYLFKKYQKNRIISALMNLSWLHTLFGGVITTILIFVNGYINMRTEHYSIVLIFWVNALLSIIVGVNFSKLIYVYIQNRFWGNWLKSIGENSIVYVCLNQIVIALLRKVICIIVPFQYVSSVLILFTTLLTLYVISIIFKNTKLNWIIGRK